MISHSLLFLGDAWDIVSKEAKELVKRMLTYDQTKRISAGEALKNPWLMKMTLKSKGVIISKAMPAFENLKKFRADTKLKQAAMTYIVSQLIDEKEKKELQKIFQSLDKNGDGKLSRQELIEGYQAVYGGLASAELAIAFEAIDIDKSGSIDYHEFLMAALSDKKVLSEKNIKEAFNLMDKVSLQLTY